MMTGSVCPDCGATNISNEGKLGRIRSKTIAGHAAQIQSGNMLRCGNCALAFRSFSLPPAAYVEAYEKLQLKYWTAHDFSPFWEDVERLLFVNNDLNLRNVLDIGCYTGDFLTWLKKRHPELEISGIEPAREAAEVAAERGVNIIGKDIGEIRSRNEYYDTVFLFDVFEHLPNIGSCLQHALSLIRTSGLLVIYTGNYDAWTWRFMANDYYYTAIPEHLVFASPSWCESFATRFNLELASLQFLSNAEATSGVFLKQMTHNFLYRVSRSLDRRGLNELNRLPFLRKASAWSQPPGWQTSKDHLLVVFRK